MKKISIVVPSFNEESNLRPMSDALLRVIPSSFDYEIIFVDDGSTDNSVKLLRELNESNSKIRFISLSRNFGHQQAVKAGIDFATGDCVITLDSDFQHPPELIPAMIEKWESGFDVVNTIRKDQDIGVVKKQTANIFYLLINRLADVEIKHGAADFRLIDKRVADVIRNIHDQHLFLRGVIPWVGFGQTFIDYVSSPRLSGESKYTLRKMIRFAIHGITSFSLKPLRMILVLGLIISLFAFLYLVYVVAVYLFTNETVQGWTSTIISVLLIGGIQLVMLGIIGEYVGKTFEQVKQRPTYIIRETSNGKRTGS